MALEVDACRTSAKLQPPPGLPSSAQRQCKDKIRSRHQRLAACKIIRTERLSSIYRMLDCCRVSVGILLTSKKLRSCVDESLVRQLIRLATGTSSRCMVAARESDICALNRFKTQTQMVRVCARIGRSLEKWCHSERESGKNLGTLRPCVPNLRRSRVTVSGSRKHPFKQQDGIYMDMSDMHHHSKLYLPGGNSKSQLRCICALEPSHLAAAPPYTNDVVIHI